MAGSHLMGIAHAWFDADRVARVFEPLIAAFAVTLQWDARRRAPAVAEPLA